MALALGSLPERLLSCSVLPYWLLCHCLLSRTSVPLAGPIPKRFLPGLSASLVTSVFSPTLGWGIQGSPRSASCQILQVNLLPPLPENLITLWWLVSPKTLLMGRHLPCLCTCCFPGLDSSSSAFPSDDCFPSKIQFKCHHFCANPLRE